MCSFEFNGIPCKVNKAGLILAPCMTVSLYCTNVNNRPVLILTILNSVFVSGTIKGINPLFLCFNSEFAQHLVCVSIHDPIVQLRRIQARLYVSGSAGRAWRFLRIHNPFGVLLFVGIFFNFVD